MTAETTRTGISSDAFQGRSAPEAPRPAVPAAEAAAEPAARSSRLAGWAMGTAVAALVLAAASPVWVPLVEGGPEAPPAAPPAAAPIPVEPAAPLAGRIEALEATVQRLAAANAAAPALHASELRALALAGAVAQLRLATLRPTPFAVELAVVSGLAERRDEFGPALGLLAAHATAGIPTLRQLRARFRDHAAAALMAEAATDDVPLAAQLATWFASTAPFGSGRLIHGLLMPATAAALGEAERRLAEEDLPGTLAALDTLSDAAAQAMRPWMAAARARIDAGRAVNHLVRTALAELPAANR